MPEPAESVLLALRILLAATLYGFLGLLVWVLLRETQPPRPAPPAASLVNVDLDGRPLRRYAISSSAWIGRDPNCSVRIDDGFVSVRHARIYRESDPATGTDTGDGLWWLEDNTSRNGTWLNGERVTRAPIKPGDRLVIGDTRFLFETTDDGPRTTES
jgi:pSer/pThr/pTyr-binding forkhead associated (FHA) protein